LGQSAEFKRPGRTVAALQRQLFQGEQGTQRSGAQQSGNQQKRDHQKLPERKSLQHDDGVMGLRLRGVEPVGHLDRVDPVHLAAKGLDENLFGFAERF
jgi:hypothetical protein